MKIVSTIVSYMLIKIVKFQLSKKRVNTVETLVSGHLVRVMKSWTVGLGLEYYISLFLVQTRFRFFAVRLQANNEHLFQKRNYKVDNDILPYTVLNI